MRGSSSGRGALRGRGLPPMRGRGGIEQARERGGQEQYSRRGRQTNVALARTTLLGTQTTNSARRLQRDYKELIEAKEPLVGVSAKPLPDDMFNWHGNLRGPEGTKWKSGVFHFQMQIPQDYPVSPPVITLFTTIPHPNVFGQNLCLDMLQTHNAHNSTWVPAYTIEAVLIQLQSFLFETLPADIQISKKIAIDDAVKQANQFSCATCKHGGPLSAQPPFAKNEQNLTDYIMVKTPKQLLGEELVCYMTKAAIKEGTLGIGISLKKSPKTGQFMYVNPICDLINMRAFTKLGVRHGLQKERFTHWLPLYFGENEVYDIVEQNYDEATEEYVSKKRTIDVKARFDKHFLNSISFICNGSKDIPFKTEQVLEFMPKLLTTHILDMMKENRHVSIVAIRRLFNFIRIFQYLIEKDPKLEDIMSSKIQNFIQDPTKRIKDNCPNLGDIQVFATMSSKFEYSQIIEPYVEEQMDRQVLWWLKELPELDFQNKKAQRLDSKTSDEDRLKICFECGKTSFFLNMLFYSLNLAIKKVTGKDSSNLQILSKALDSNHGCLQQAIEDEFQQTIFKNMKTESFMDYFKNLGLEQKSQKECYDNVIQAFKNSRRKGYHGDDLDGLKRLQLRPIQEQAEQRILKILQSFTDVEVEKEILGLKTEAEEEDNIIVDVGSIKLEEEQKVKYKLKVKDMKLKESVKTDQDWKNLAQETFDFIKIILESNPEISAAKLAAQSDFDEIEGRFFSNQGQNLDLDKLYSQRLTFLGRKKENFQLISDYDENSFTFKQLMLKLVFERLVYDLQFHQSFELIYEFLKVFSDQITVLKINLIDKKKLKSNHYWLMVVLPRLTKLKVLKIYKDTIDQFGEDGYKFLTKALNYLQKNGGSLHKFSMNHQQNNNSKDYLYPCLKSFPEIQELSFKNFTLTLSNCKAIGKVLSDFKQIRLLDLSFTNLSGDNSKEIADGLMRAKQLEVLKLDNNPSLKVDQIIYNLAFSPKIQIIDCTKVNDCGTDNSVTAFYKLLKISGSIKKLILKNTTFFAKISNDFCQALGENKTLEYLDISQIVINQQANTRQISNIPASQLLGKSIAMNNYKNGSLQVMILQNILSNDIESFAQGFWISDYDHEIWYGDQKVAAQMKEKQLDKNLYCGLKVLDIGQGNLITPLFKLKDLEKQSNPKWPFFIKFLAKSKLENLQLDFGQITSKEIEFWSVAIGKNPIGPCSSLQVLNLAHNKISIEGAKLLASALEENKSIKFLDLSDNQLMVYGVTLISRALEKNTNVTGLNLFKNTFDVDGCRALRELLKVNKNLEFLDIGHNRIRAKGLEEIGLGLKGAANSKLQTLGLRMNFLNDESFSKFFNEIILTGISKISQLFISQNNISQLKTNELLTKAKQNEKITKIFVDIFEKQHYMKEEKVSRTMWFGPLANHTNSESIGHLNYYLDQNKTGLIKQPIRFRIQQSKKGLMKRRSKNTYLFVEFESEMSISKIPQLVRKRKLTISEKVYLAGTNTYTHIRKSKRN